MGTVKAKGRLYGWKDIADYVGCSVTTIKRYAKLGLPVNYLWKKPTAKPDKIDEWIENNG